MTKGGYDYGFTTIQGLGKFSGKAIKVIFQNENVIVHDVTDGNVDATKENSIVTTPDIIAGTYVITIFHQLARWHTLDGSHPYIVVTSKT